MDTPGDLQTPSLRTLARSCGLPVGACVDLTALESEPQYAAVLARESDMCVAEKVFKPACRAIADRLREGRTV